MPAYKVLKPFLLSRDGLTSTAQTVDEVIDLSAKDAAGLVAEKYLEEVPAAPAPSPAVPEPEPVVTPAPESPAPAPSAPGGKRRG